MIVSILFLPVALQLESTRVRRKKSTTECPQLGTKNNFYKRLYKFYQDKQQVSPTTMFIINIKKGKLSP